VYVAQRVVELKFSRRSSLSDEKEKKWSWLWDLNPQPPDYKSGALPIELSQLGAQNLPTQTQVVKKPASDGFLAFWEGLAE
jgi:hypothetical protein